MSTSSDDPTKPIRMKAGSYPGVEVGTSCTQSSFKVGKKAFLYIGTQGGRCKAMFKLKDCIPEARELAEQDPDCYQVGAMAWVTARFTAEKPMPGSVWVKWLDESYSLSLPATKKKTASAKTTTRKARPKKKK